MSITDNMRVPYQYLGMTGLLCPGAGNISAGRQDLFAKNIGQPRIPGKPDFPNVFSGFEAIFSDYTFDSTKRENKVRIINIVDKYPMSIAGIRAGSNPIRTVIYRDLITGEVSYFNIKKFSSYSNDYGYENITHVNLKVGDIIDPDAEIYSSPAKEGDIYKLGVNANVAFITTPETIEDCFGISESLAKRLSPKSIETKSITVNIRNYPLNLYGDEEQYKLFPDIGDTVNQDGILCAFRPIRGFSAISDLMPEKLVQINHMFDHKIYAHPGAQVIDVDVYIDNKNTLPDRIYDQVKLYHDARLQYWRDVVETHQSVINLPISHKFNTLVTRAIGRLLAAKQRVANFTGKKTKPTLVDKFNPVTLKIDITLVHQVIVNKGHKISGREGAKGVIIVKPDDEMPMDEQGFRADICIDPISAIKRTNIFQLYEQYINRVCKWQAMHLNELGSIEDQYNRILELTTDINPMYGEKIRTTIITPEEKKLYVEQCKRDTISVCIPPTMDNINKELVSLLREKYKTPISRATFAINTSTGRKVVTTKEPVVIGTKYIYLLSKYPKPLAPSYGYVNKCHTPIHKKDKSDSPIGSTPIRFGESESRIFATTVDIPTVLRLKSLFSGSRIGPKMMIEALASTPNPHQLDHVEVSTEELYNEAPAIRIAHHMFETAGIDLQNSLISAEEAEDIFKSLL